MSLRERSFTIRRGLAAGLVGASVLAGAACGGDSDSAEGATTLTFMSWWPMENMQPIVDRFEELNPDITVEMSSTTSATEYVSTLQTRLLAGTAPDVFILGDKRDQVGGGYVRDLTDEPFMERIAEVNREYGEWEDRYYGMSISSWGGGILYNAELLAEVGFSEPPASWQEFLDLAQQLQDAGITPYYEAGDGVSVSLCALLGLADEAAGGNLDEQVFAGETTWQEHWTEAVSAWDQLLDRGLMTRDVVGLNGGQTTDEFARGNVAMVGTGSWALGGIKESAPDMDMRFMAVPGIEDGTSYWCGAASPAYAVNADAEEPEAALAFLDFLSSEEGAGMFNEITREITTTSTFDPEVDPALEAMVEPVRAGSIYLPVVHWPRYSAALDTEFIVLLQRLIQGQAEPDDVTAGLDAELAELEAG